MNNFRFYINKHSFTFTEEVDASFIPMMMRRKLNSFGKVSLFNLYNCYQSEFDCDLVFGSSYGDVERIKKLLLQKEEEGEVSPMGFSFSVHNATIGLFSLLNKIKSSYNSISAGKDTLSFSLLDAIMLSKEKPVLYCFTETEPSLQSIGLSISKEKQGFQVELISRKEPLNIHDDISSFVDFLEGKVNIYSSKLYELVRV